MATKTRLKSGNFRIQFRVKYLKMISRTFISETEANAYQSQIGSQLTSIRDLEKSTLPVDMTVLYKSLHPDIRAAVLDHPAFVGILGQISSDDITLSGLIYEFVCQYTKKDKTMLERLKWWDNEYGKLKICDITEDHVRHGLNKLQLVGSTGKKKVLPQTTNRFKANLSSVFEFGKDKYKIRTNPCRHIKGKPEGKGRLRYLTRTEQQRLLDAAKKSKWDKLYLLILMAITCGNRRGELCKNLRWGDIDWIKAQAVFRNTKNGRDKISPLTEAVMDELKRFRDDADRLVFASNKKPSSPYNFRKAWEIALKEARINLIDEKGEKIVFHTLRHTFCSTLANAGIATHMIASLANHANIQTTMRYIHADEVKLASEVNNTFNNLR